MIRLWTIAVILAFAGCSDGVRTPDDTLVIGQVSEPRTLDPHVATSTNDFRILANIYEGLVRFADGSLEIEPALAESWKISDDATVYTFSLRKGVSFHDGGPLNAEAVRFNFERMRDPDHPFRHTGPFPLAFFFDAIETIETPDSHTIRFVLGEPFAPFLANLAYPTGYIISPEHLKKYDTAFARNPSGTGPFRFVDWISRRRVLLETFADYHGDPPAMQRLLFRPINDENARLTEMLSGGVDVILEVPPDIIQFFRQQEAYKVLEREGPHLWFCILNTREGVFKNPQMRRAVNMAVNRHAISSDLLQGTATPAHSAFPEAFAIYDQAEDYPRYPYDPQKASQIVADEGFEGAELTFLVTESGSGMLEPRAMAEAIQADLARIGLRVRIETYEWNTFLSKVNQGLEGEADMAQMAWMTNDPDTLPFLTLREAAWPEAGGFNSGYFADARLDDLLEIARSTADEAQRRQLYREANQLIFEQAPWLVVASWRQNTVVRREVQDLELQPSFLLKLERARK